MKKSTTLSKIATAAVLAAALVGCGKNPAATKKLPSRQPLQTTLPPTGYAQQPGVPGAPGAAGGNAQQILALVRQAQQTQTGFSGTVDTWEKAPNGKVSTQELQCYWKRPETLKIKIVKGDSQSQDCQVLWDGSNSMKVKPSWLPFGAVSVSISDDRVVSSNKWTIKETDVSCILGVLLDPSAQVSVVGPQVVDGKSVTLLNVKSPKSPRGVTQEQIGIDPTMNLPVVRMMYKGNNLAYKLVAKSFKLGTPSSDKLTI